MHGSIAGPSQSRGTWRSQKGEKSKSRFNASSSLGADLFLPHAGPSLPLSHPLDHSSPWKVESCLWKEACPDMETFLHCLKACKGLVLRRMLDQGIYQYQVGMGNTWIIICNCLFPGSYEKVDPFSSTKEEMFKQNQELKMRLALSEKEVIFSKSCLK